MQSPFQVPEAAFALIQPVSPPRPQSLAGFDDEIMQRLPDGVVSAETVDGNLVLRASGNLQERFEELLERHKAGALTPEETEDDEAMQPDSPRQRILPGFAVFSAKDPRVQGFRQTLADTLAKLLPRIAVGCLRIQRSHRASSA